MTPTTLNDLLEIAIRHEISSQNFYRESYQKTSDPKVRHFLKTLIEEEEGHERMLKNIKEMEIYDGSLVIDPAVMSKADSSHDVDIPDLSGEPTMEEIYEIALKRETKAYNIFKQMAETVRNDELKELFSNLAAEEQIHHKDIDEKYHAQTGQMGNELG